MPKSLFRGSFPNDPGYAVDVPTRWRDCSDLSLVWFYALAVQEAGGAWAFSLSLSNPTKQRMKQSGLSEKDFLTRRFQAYCRGLPYFFVLEFSPAGNLHLHGALSAPGQGYQEVLARLRKLCGDRRKLAGQDETYFFDRRAVALVAPGYDRSWQGRRGLFGWAGYCAKDVKRSRRRLGASPIACSRELSQRARLIHADVVG